MVICRLEVLHKVNNLVKEWIRDISIKKVSLKQLAIRYGCYDRQKVSEVIPSDICPPRHHGLLWSPVIGHSYAVKYTNICVSARHDVLFAVRYPTWFAATWLLLIVCCAQYGIHSCQLSVMGFSIRHSSSLEQSAATCHACNITVCFPQPPEDTSRSCFPLLHPP